MSACKSAPPKPQAAVAAPAAETPAVPEVAASLDTPERLKELQNAVYALENRIYGQRKGKGDLGLYGDLKSCRRKLASPQFAGSGSMIWSEPLDRVTDMEEEAVKANQDLGDQTQRFQAYKFILQRRADDLSAGLASCSNELTGKEMDSNQPTRVMVTEAPKQSVERQPINDFICGYVKEGASLQTLMRNAFARGWLSLTDYRLNQNLIAVSLKDSKGEARDNALLFNGWKLAFNRAQVTVAELFNDGKDARLVAWAFEKKAEVSGARDCLSAADGRWNP